MNKSELLKVLDMSEDEQWEWIEDNINIEREWKTYYADYGGTFSIDKKASLADLAFRLRDEAVKLDQWSYSEIIRDICQYVNKPKANNCKCFDAAMWLEIEGKPIHIITAAIKVISKESPK